MNVGCELIKSDVTNKMSMRKNKTIVCIQFISFLTEYFNNENETIKRYFDLFFKISF